MTLSSWEADVADPKHFLQQFNYLERLETITLSMECYVSDDSSYIQDGENTVVNPAPEGLPQSVNENCLLMREMSDTQAYAGLYEELKIPTMITPGLRPGKSTE
jgi:hypothetical protein